MTDRVRPISSLLTFLTLGDPARDARRIPNDEPLTRRRTKRSAIAADEKILHAGRKIERRGQAIRRANAIDSEESNALRSLAVRDYEPLAAHGNHAVRMDDARRRLGGVSFL